MSVIIPALDEERLLDACLTALSRQDYAGRWEVIVVDNSSRDGTAGVAARHGAVVVREPQRGAAAARRAGFAAARAQILVSTDADSAAPPDWLTRIATAFADDPGAAGLVGGIAYTSDRPGVELALRALTAAALFVDRRFGGHFSEANFAVRRSAYEAVGGFRVGASEGIDLSRRLRRAGYRLRVDHRLRVRTSARRFEEAFLSSAWVYARNWLYMAITGRQYPRPLASGGVDQRAALSTAGREPQAAQASAGAHGREPIAAQESPRSRLRGGDARDVDVQLPERRSHPVVGGETAA